MRKLLWLGGLGVALMCCGVSGLMFGGLRSALKGSDPYRRGVLRATTDARAQGVLGTPIEVGWMVNGELLTKNGAGTADLTVPLDGPNRAGKLHIQAHTERNGEWVLDALMLAPDGAAPVDLLKD